jgi:hypothetical protein
MTIAKGELPNGNWKAHTFAPTGQEYIVVGENMWVKDAGQTVWKQMTAVEYFGNDSPIPAENESADMAQAPKLKKTDTTWESGMLFDYFDGQKIQQSKTQEKAETTTEFPIQGFETQALSSKGLEMITKGNIVMYRDTPTSKIWNSATLGEYFKDQVVINATPDAADEQLPTTKLKTHAFSTDGFEIITYKDRFWRRKEGANKWETGQLKDYFADVTVDKGTLPLTHWDIHTFSPEGREIIVVGEALWSVGSMSVSKGLKTPKKSAMTARPATTAILVVRFRFVIPFQDTVYAHLSNSVIPRA